MLRDIDYFTARLGKIDGFDDAGEYLANIIKSKEIQQTAATTRSSSPASTGTDGKAADSAGEGRKSGDNLKQYVAAQVNGSAVTEGGAS
jgi:hypothetical protein